MRSGSQPAPQSQVTGIAMEVRSLLPLLAAVVLLLGGGYLLYARARIEDAIAEASRRAGVTVRYHVENSWRAGHVRLRDLVIASESKEWSLQLEHVDITLFPVLGGPRLIRLEIPDQIMQLRTTSFQWQSGFRAGAELAGLATFGPETVRRAALDVWEGVLHSQAYTLHAVSAELILTGARQAHTEPLLRGNLSLRGGTGAAMLGILGARAVTRGFSAESLSEPVELESEISVTRTGVKLESLALDSGEIAVEGRVAFHSTGSTGALRPRTAAQAVDLHAGGGEIGRELR